MLLPGRLVQSSRREGPDEADEAGRRHIAEWGPHLAGVRGPGSPQARLFQQHLTFHGGELRGTVSWNPKCLTRTVSHSGPDGTLLSLLDSSLSPALGSGQASLPLQSLPLPGAVTSVRLFMPVPLFPTASPAFLRKPDNARPLWPQS